MSDKEKIQSIFSRFYNYDSETKKVQEEFLENKDFYSGLLEDTLRAVCEIERQSGISLPEQYKEFLKAGVGNYIYNPDSIDEFRAYDARELYEFNHVGGKAGYSAIEELKDFLIVGQDEGECSYSFDPFNRLGYGIDAVWKVNRGAVGDGNKWFDLVADNFYDFVESYALKNEKDGNYVFNPGWKEIKPWTDDYVSFLEKKCNEVLGLDPKLSDELTRLERYLEIMKKNPEAFHTRNFSYDGSLAYIKSNEEIFVKNASLAKLLYAILKAGDITISAGGLYLGFLSDLLEKHNRFFEKKKMFAFYYNENSLLSDEDIFAWDLFFIDPTNRLGNGPDAIYMIGEKSKKLEEACLVAKDIVDLFRLFAEGAELNTTPLGKAK